MRTFIDCLIYILLISLVNGFKNYFPLKAHSRTLLKSMIECPVGEFQSQVIQSKVPVVVDFYANWCGPCKLVGPIFKQCADEFPAEKVKFVKVDTDLFPDLVDKYNMQGLPLFGLFINGEIVSSHSGAMNRESLKAFVNNGLKKENLMI